MKQWWQFYVGGNVYHYKIQGSIFEDVKVNTSRLVYSVNTTTTFRFSPTMQLQLVMNYLSKIVTAQGEDSRFINPGASVRKAFMKGKLAATLQWQNIDL